MPQPSSTNNLAIGKGIVSIAEWSGGSIGSYYDMGNVNSLEIEPTIERLPHYSSRSGFRTKDKNPIIQTEYVLTIVAEEVAAVNLNRFLIGTLSGANTILGLQGTNKEYAVRFVSDNPIGPNQTWDFWKLTLSPNGPMQLIGEEWMSMSFTGEGLADTGGHPTSPYFTVVSQEATSTTTTTTTTTT